jgi:hypothetical protein
MASSGVIERFAKDQSKDLMLLLFVCPFGETLGQLSLQQQIESSGYLSDHDG